MGQTRIGGERRNAKDTNRTPAQLPSHLMASTPSPEAVSDADALAMFLSEIQQLELFQFEDDDASREEDGGTAFYYSIQEGESVIQKHCVALECLAQMDLTAKSPLRKKRLSSTQRRRLEVERLRASADQLQQRLAELERKKAEEQQQRSNGDRSPMDAGHRDEMWANTATEVENGYLQEQITGLQLLVDKVISLMQQSANSLQVGTRSGLKWQLVWLIGLSP